MAPVLTEQFRNKNSTQSQRKEPAPKIVIFQAMIVAENLVAAGINQRVTANQRHHIDCVAVSESVSMPDVRIADLCLYPENKELRIRKVRAVGLQGGLEPSESGRANTIIRIEHKQ